MEISLKAPCQNLTTQESFSPGEKVIKESSPTQVSMGGHLCPKYKTTS
jgi:hypothetical protein